MPVHPFPTVPAPAGAEPGGMVRLAADRRRSTVDVAATVLYDAARRGAVCVAHEHGARRAEPGPAGPLVFEARRRGGEVELAVWGPPDTPRAAAESALAAAAAWAGLDDDPGDFDEVVGSHRFVARLRRALGVPRLSRMPRVGEAVGRSLLAQLVQQAEARRSTAQLAALAGHPAPGGLCTWPEPRQVGAVPAHALRGRCGVSLRGARALHAAAVADRRLREAARECRVGRPGPGWDRLDGRLRALPGVGGWTAAEVRLALGDPDAVSVGDYNLPDLVGTVLGEAAGRRPDSPDGSWTDAAMLDLLAPFAPHRARVVRLVLRAVARRLVPGPRRRAPRAALSAHRYW